MFQTSTKRHFSFPKLTLLLIVIFQYEIQDQINIQQEYFQRDIKLCEQCFENQIENCTKFLNRIEIDTAPNLAYNLLNILPLNSKRLNNFFKIKTQTGNFTKIISKSLSTSKINSFGNQKNIEALKIKFIENENLDGLQLCPITSDTLTKFVKFVVQQTQHNELSVLLHLLTNIEPLLLPMLEHKGFPVPKTYATCGLTLFQSYEGKALLHFYNAPLHVKIEISRQLLEAVLKFSQGFADFRFYITDLSADNLVWNEKTSRLYLVDLDTLLIVDSKAVKYKRQFHKHSYIECDNCFAYSQQEICDYQISDINFFAACQFLREDLNRNREAGFLYPISEEILSKYPELQTLLDKCVDCDENECSNRFIVAEELMKLLDLILMDL